MYSYSTLPTFPIVTASIPGAYKLILPVMTKAVCLAGHNTGVGKSQLFFPFIRMSFMYLTVRLSQAQLVHHWWQTDNGSYPQVCAERHLPGSHCGRDYRKNPVGPTRTSAPKYREAGSQQKIFADCWRPRVKWSRGFIKPCSSRC